MKISYYPETDSLYIELRPGPGSVSREIAIGLNVDLDSHGNVVGFDIDGASTRSDLSVLETVAVPIQPVHAAQA